MTTNLIGLGYRAGVGKDTAAAALAEYGWQRAAFADALRGVAYESSPHLAELVNMHGWDAAKRIYPSCRQHLERLGMAVRKYAGADVWINACLFRVDPAVPTVITDVRLPNECEAIKARGGVLIRIDRHDYDELNSQHITEHALRDYPFDAVVVNDGTPAELADRILRAVTVLKVGP